MVELPPNAEMSQELISNWQAPPVLYRSLSSWCQSHSVPSSLPDPNDNIKATQLTESRYISYTPGQSYSRPSDQRLRQSQARHNTLDAPKLLQGPHWHADFLRKRFLRKQINHLAVVTEGLSLEEREIDVDEARKQARHKDRERREQRISVTEMEWHIFGCGESMDDGEESRLRRKVPLSSGNSSNALEPNTKADLYCMTMGTMVSDSTTTAPRHAAARPIIPLRRTQKFRTSLTTVMEAPEPGQPLEPDAVETCSSRFTSLRLAGTTTDAPDFGLGG